MSKYLIKLFANLLIISILSSCTLLHVEEKIKLPLESSQRSKAPTNNWLQDADSDAERFVKLEKYLRGFDQPMWEVGERYQIFYHAIKDKNWGLASYQWKKIKRTINTGLMKRPKRAKNAKVMFLETVWPQLNKSIDSMDYMLMEKDFMAARQACMLCHIAENVDFINNQPMFRDLVFTTKPSSKK